MTRILVTGASGFFGTHCLPLLADRGLEVHAVARRPLRSPGAARTHAVDLLRPGEAARLVRRVKPELLLHLAWEATPGRFWTSAGNRDWLARSLDLFRAFAEAGGRCIVGAGSCAEYATGDRDCDERETPCEPATVYGAAKRDLCRAGAALAAETGLRFAWARFFHVYGPHEPAGKLVPTIIQGLVADRPVPLTDCGQRRDFIYVEDAMAALVELLFRPVSGPVNIAGGGATTLKAMAETIGRLTGRGHLLRFGSLPRPPDDADRLVADLRRLRTELKFAPRFDLEAGLERTIAFWRDRRAIAETPAKAS